jgi:transposase
MAFLRCKRRRKGSEVYESWAVVESVRTARGPRQRTIATLGKAPGLDEEERMGWEDIAQELSGRRPSADLFGCRPDPPEWARVDLRRVRVERLRRFGDVYAALAVWSRLRLNEFFERELGRGREKVPWSVMACLHAIARLCEPSSDLAIAESFFSKTALDDLLGVSPEQINDDRLYRSLDVVVDTREALFAHLREAYGELFGCEFDVLLYDATSTFFEGQMGKSELTLRGYSRDSRPDCVQVMIGLIVTPEGLPVAYEVFAGNRHDSTTLEEMIDLIERKYGRACRTWVLDRGMVSEENLSELRRRNAWYIVGTPRQALRKVEQKLLDHDWEEVEPGIELKLIDLPAGEDESGMDDPGGRELYVLCRSKARVEKDAAIVTRAEQKLAKALEKMRSRIEKGQLSSRAKAERQVGKLLALNWRAGRLFDVAIEEVLNPDGPSKTHLTMTIKRNDAARSWLQLQNGCYLLRTNLIGQNAHQLWRTYIGLTQAESAFRQIKSPLGLRPIFHRTDRRIQAHIFVCFLALAMRRVLALWMENSGLGQSPDKLLAELRTIHSLDVVLAAKQMTELRLRLVSTPDERVRLLLHHLGLRLPNRPRRIQNVVPTSACQKNCAQGNQSSTQ